MIFEILIIIFQIIIILLLGYIIYNYHNSNKKEKYDTNDFRPIGINGKPVDWWAIIKLPNGYQKTFDCDKANNECDNNKTESLGLGYLYADSNNPKFVLQSNSSCLNQNTSPLETTINLIQQGKYVIWNDEGSKFGSGCSGIDKNAPFAHSKGIAGLINNQGIIMNVSTPNFPVPKKCPNQDIGCQQDNSTIVCQHFFCFSVDSSNFNLWLKNVQKASLIVQDNSNDFPVSNLIYNCKKQNDNSNLTSLKTLAGQKIDLIIKSCSVLKSPWLTVSDILKQNLNILSWYAYPWEEPTKQLTRIAKLKINDFEWTGTGDTSPEGNHAKIGVTQDESCIIFGSMNMQTSQAKRGGDFYVLYNSDLAKSFMSLVTKTTILPHDD